MPFDNDELNATEQQALERFMSTDQTVPPPDETEGAPAEPVAPTPPAAPAPAPAAPPVDPAAAAPVAAPAPGGEPSPAGDPPQTDDERFAAWQSQHAGKTPEELARLAFQQSQRANGAEARARTAQQSVQQINERVQQATQRAQAARDAARQRQQQFNEQLQNDPDAATRQLADERHAAELRQIDAEEFQARQAAAVGLATQALPGFAESAGQIQTFGGEMGYSPEELDSISDGRDLVVLGMAERFARLVKGGIIDLNGQLLQRPEPVAATDPRLNTPAPVPTLSSAPARPAGSGPTAEKQATDLLGLSDADFAKLPPGEFDAIMRQLQG